MYPIRQESDIFRLRIEGFMKFRWKNKRKGGNRAGTDAKIWSTVKDGRYNLSSDKNIIF
jgi:hypothetical protein